ncbi:MAG: hypothetical protein HKN30_06105 [Sulfitobacter sp.]|nr:hypothetical protein [Sulfitobacter sp.]
MKYLVSLVLLVGLLSGCSNDPTGDAPAEAAAAAAYGAPGPKSVTVFTMVNNRTGRGGHSALLINGSQQVIFDPAGSFRDPRLVERQDVLYGVTPGWVQAYKSAHARASHHVVSQTIELTPEQAEKALSLARSYGSVPGAFCTQATTAILSQLTGFQDIERTYYPENLMEQLAQRRDVQTAKLYENDDGQVIDAVRAALLAQQP